MYDPEVSLILEREAGMPETVSPVAVGFYNKEDPEPKKTAELGRPFYINKTFVYIMTPGNRNDIYDQPAKDSHIKRFPKAYELYKQHGKTIENGTPLHEWAPMTRADVLNFRACGINTVEALAAVSDDNLDKIGYGAGIRELRAQAQAFLANAKDNAAAQAQAIENQKLKDQIAAMQAQIDALGKRRELPVTGSDPEAAELEEYTGVSARGRRKAS